MTTILLIPTIAAAIIAGASVALKVIAPLTKSTADDKVLGWLGKLESLLQKLALDSKAKK